MTLFWLLLGLMIVIGLAIVLPPLLKHNKSNNVPRDVLNVAIYKDQIAELEADLKNETLSPEQYEQGLRDLERNLLADVSEVQQHKGALASSKTSRATALLVVIMLPTLALGMYLKLGESDLIASPSTMVASGQPGNMGGIDPEQMVQRLAERLKKDPKDGTGWALLGRSYAVLGRFPEASQAYAKAVELLGSDDPQLLADYAEVLALSNPDQNLAGKPTELFQQVLKMDPANQKALWLAGMAAFQKEDFRGATDYWKRLTASLPEDSENAQTIKGYIAEAEARAAGSLTR